VGDVLECLRDLPLIELRMDHCELIGDEWIEPASFPTTWIGISVAGNQISASIQDLLPEVVPRLERLVLDGNPNHWIA